jgi:hypothetical protein
MSEGVWVSQVDGFYRDTNAEVLECGKRIDGSE